MTSQFSPKVSQILAFSREEATRLASSSVGPEHLMLGLMRERKGTVLNLLISLDIELGNIKAALEEHVRSQEQKEPVNTMEPILNEKASNILRLAVLEARILHSTMVEAEHILLPSCTTSRGMGLKMYLKNITCSMTPYCILIKLSLESP